MKVKIGPYRKNTNHRKIQIEIEKFDTWNLDSTLAYIILPALIQLKQTKHGIPNNFAEVGGASHEAQDSFDFYKETYDESFSKGDQRWNEVLDKMIWAFHQLLIDYESRYHHGRLSFQHIVEHDQMIPNPVTGKLEKVYKILSDNPGNSWFDVEGSILHQERIQEGLELFGKYYRSLWD